MASQPNTATGHETSHHARRHLRSLLEYLGMVAAMLAGMVILGLIRDLVAPGPVLRADVEAIIMASEMVIGMSAWMVARRHAWRGIVVMSAVMYLPFLILAPLFWVGTISGDVLAAGGHLLMLPAMALAMPLTHRTRGPAERLRLTEAPTMEAGASSADLGATGEQPR
ncbi:hypothetical protein [Cryobacterium mannosilyticum]|uniref:Flagellar biosynthetic protein FliP n=1 Tax=Cryobacterium mannosilyticum TaxID=1259190 RepID=A0A4R8WCG1_9MICO|nr:hypothetical protein [Cryobacterium mannosilyticum]TFC06383.1 hypothetical protein E3O32_04695 [Cryobacterium mannosilyticum]